MTVTPLPIYVVREALVPRRIERLGEWRPATKVLALEAEGFPFLGPGEHPIEGDLPWVFWEMCPAGIWDGRLLADTPSSRWALIPACGAPPSV